MNNFKIFVRCVFGPRLFSFYRLTGHTLSSKSPEVLSQSHQYQPSIIEAVSDHFIRIADIIAYYGFYLSPALISYIYFRQGSTDISQELMIRAVVTAFVGYIASYLIRGFGRLRNTEYLAFLQVLTDCRRKLTISNKRILAHFDFEFDSCPVDFEWSEAKDDCKPAQYKDTTRLILDSSIFKYPIRSIMNLVMKIVGKRMIYPGSLKFLQAIMNPAIKGGRTRLIEEFGGTRYKLKSFDGNSIDSMFVDRRGGTSNGDILVVGCEGNGGFYELGSISTPLEAGYSVLGWNHPGFGGTTGEPYPDQDIAAIDTVMRFATCRLKFDRKNILIYGWSIGGYPASWAAMRYPDIQGVVIDASFDHILPLARRLFPSLLYPLIEIGIRDHFDLDNSNNLKKYKGPVLFIRRSQDEVIATDPYNSTSTNRSNNLLIDVLSQRFPQLIDVREISLIKEYLSGNSRHQERTLRQYSVNSANCMRLLTDYFRTNLTSYPVNIGPELDNVQRDQLTLFLTSKYLIDYDSVHCAPLPPWSFQKPWDLMKIAMR